LLSRDVQVACGADAGVTRVDDALWRDEVDVAWRHVFARDDRANAAAATAAPKSP